MPSKDTEILEFNRYQKSGQATIIIYADLHCLIEKIDGSKNNPENSSTTKVDFSMSAISSFKSLENKHGIYRGKDCMKNFCEYLREHAMEMINFNKKEN